MNTTEQASAEPQETVVDAEQVTPSPETVDEIIRKRVYAAVAMGFVPLPLVDLAGLTAIQLEMLHALCKVHNIPFKRQWVKSSISALCGGGVTVVAVPLLSSLLKSIPVIGVPTGAATISMSGAASTYALGRVFDRHFRNGGTLTNFDAEKSKAYFAEKVEEGKAFIKKMNPRKPSGEAEQSASETA